MVVVCLFPNFLFLSHCGLCCLFTFGSFLLFFQLSLKLLLAIMLVLQSKLALLVYFFKLILEELQSIKESGLSMVLIQYIDNLFLILLWDTFVEYGKSGSTFGIFGGIYIKIESILNKLEMQVDFFIEEQRPNSNAEVSWLILLMPEVISEFPDYLVVLFLCAVGYLIDQVQIFFSLEIQLFILQDLCLHLWGLTKIREFFEICLHKLNLAHFVIDIFLILIGILLRTLVVLVQSKQEVNLLYFLVSLIDLFLYLQLFLIQAQHFFLIFYSRFLLFIQLIIFFLSGFILLLFWAFRLDLHLMMLFSLFLLIRRLFIQWLVIFLRLQLLFQIGELL